ncbi:Pentapeptide repeats (8 copies) [Enhygromyxa salina]|uniref:Pentapeptide repeats (8 copies) n=1 Tax=Enhygromyxa salina TaxID=215803 RepID=A0A2S9YAZ9_9BACT|nr:pentapeptide repeat-containing protein [Enhygromyxa salina]PRQ02279.1 Pentapeptide repeats (8 copies) [Enhygromyxa salina]
MAKPTPLPPPTAEELGWLRRAPPTDAEGRRVPWTLEMRRVNEVKWIDEVAHDQVTLSRVLFTATHWTGPVFRNCVLRDVSFARTTLAGARFEGVVFERCNFESSTLEGCAFEGCRFVECSMRYVTAVRTKLLRCVFEVLRVTVLELRECDLSGTRFENCQLEGPRVTRARAETLDLRGGELRGADFTACTIDKLSLAGVAVAGLRIIDCEFVSAELLDARVAELSISGTKARRLTLRGCPELPGARVLDCRLLELRVEACPAIPSLLVADSVLGGLMLRDAVLYDAAFERLEVRGACHIVGGALTGVFFNGGSWAQTELVDVALNDYVAVNNARFEQLELEQLQVDPALDLRLHDDTYGEGSMTWGDARGS